LCLPLLNQRIGRPVAQHGSYASHYISDAAHGLSGVVRDSDVELVFKVKDNAKYLKRVQVEFIERGVQIQWSRPHTPVLPENGQDAVLYFIDGHVTPFRAAAIKNPTANQIAYQKEKMKTSSLCVQKHASSHLGPHLLIVNSLNMTVNPNY
jgi:hypothetical protein